jgi:hypothetical protein
VNSLHIAWGSLGQIFLVSFGTAVGVIVIFSLGVAVLAPSTQAPSSQLRALHPLARRAVAALCFTACVLVVGYGLALIVAK